MASADNPGFAVPVGTTSTPVLGDTPGASVREFVNDSDTKIYLRLAATGAAVGSGIPLYPNGGAWSTQYNGPVSAIHGGTGTKTLCGAEI